MIKAVLLDLDNTLLKNSDSVFVAEYFRLMDDYFFTRWNTTLSSTLRRVIKASMSRRDPQHTNSQIAQQILAEETGKTAEELAGVFIDFYAEVYPNLRRCTEPVPGAAALVDYLREHKYAIAIATNPLYPPEAIRQRIAWAGLPDTLDAYTLVTHADNMHFVKPDAAYYAEIVARIGVEPDEAVMVGDSLVNDIEPAAWVGLNTFTITDEGNSTYAGSLSHFYQTVISHQWLEAQTPRPLMPEAIEPELRGNIGAFFGLLNEVKPHHWNQHPDPNEWSILQVVCHLLESERQIQQPRLRRILEEDNPFLVQPQAPPGPEAAACDTDGIRAAREFAQLREHTIEWLGHLQPDDWHRPARHSVFGLTSLLEMAHFTAQHDRLHINQICQTLGRCQ